mmetsp:Transcript_34609/g.99660  ORF Transcript_34609/g.99660 Transcript_34609/m.99660 type:complete len:109 (-) Transcript_34609:1171-1497(-)
MRAITGMPIHTTYTDFTDLWDRILNTKVLDSGDESTPFALAVRVFAYPGRLYSVWLLVACLQPTILHPYGTTTAGGAGSERASQRQPMAYPSPLLAGSSRSRWMAMDR